MNFSCSIICILSGEVPCSIEEEKEQSISYQLYVTTHKIYSYIEREVGVIADSCLKDV